MNLSVYKYLTAGLLVTFCLTLSGCRGSDGSSTKAENGKSTLKEVHLTRSTFDAEDSGRQEDHKDWPCFLGQNQDGVSLEEGILKDWTEGKLPVLWTRDLGEGYAPGVTYEGRYYHFDRTGDDARLVCLDADSGDELWQYTYACDYRDLYGYDGGPRSSPTIDGELVFIYGVEGMLHALNRESGDVVWEVDVNEQFHVHQNFFGVGSPPVVFKDRLLVMVGGSPADNDVRRGQLDQALPDNSAIVAFDKLTGEVAYQTGNDLASYSSIKLARINGLDWGFALCRSGLIAFDPNDGTIRFEFPWRDRKLESVNASTPVVHEDFVLLSECYGVGGVLLKLKDDSPDGFEVVWKDAGRDKRLMTHWNTPVFHDGFVYASSGRHTNDATLTCVELATGEVKWRQAGLTRCNMTFVDGHLAIVAENGNLFLLRANPEKFDPVTRFKTEGEFNAVRLLYPCWAAPIISNGLMFVRGKDQVVCFRLTKD